MSATSYDLNDTMDAPRFVMSLLTVDEFTRFWPQIESMLDTVPHTWDRWTKEFIYERVAEDKMQVWGIGPPPRMIFVFITTVCIFPAKRVLSVEWGAGSFEPGMLPLLKETLSNYGRMNGCSELEVKGRRGWGPMFKSIGMEHKHEMWSLPIEQISLN